MHDGLQRAADRFGDRVGIWFGDDQITFAELDARSNAFARYLYAKGVARGDRVAIMLNNRPEFIAAVHGISRCGAAAVLLSPAWKAREVGHAVELTRPVHAVVETGTATVVTEQIERVTDVDDPATIAAVDAHGT